MRNLFDRRYYAMNGFCGSKVHRFSLSSSFKALPYDPVRGDVDRKYLDRYPYIGVSSRDSSEGRLTKPLACFASTQTFRTGFAGTLPVVSACGGGTPFMGEGVGRGE